MIDTADVAVTMKIDTLAGVVKNTAAWVTSTDMAVAGMKMTTKVTGAPPDFSLASKLILTPTSPTICPALDVCLLRAAHPPATLAREVLLLQV
jgi:hypothetical protein